MLLSIALMYSFIIFLQMGLQPQIDTDFYGLKKQNFYLCFIRVHLWLKRFMSFAKCV